MLSLPGCILGVTFHSNGLNPWNQQQKRPEASKSIH